MITKIHVPSTDVAFEKIDKFSILQNIQPVSYRPTIPGLDPSLSGQGVRIAILDTGEPRHKDLPVPDQSLSFCDSNKSVEDKIGHATMVAGIISSHNPLAVQGVAPQVSLLYGKVMSDDKKCSFNNLVSGVLWAIVRDVDIIVMALGSQYDYKILYDSIIKAKERGICIFSATGPNIDKSDYPANYKEVFSCGYLSRYKIKNDIIKSHSDFYLPNKLLSSTYLGDQYLQIGGTSISTAFFAGVGALFIEDYKKKGIVKEEIPNNVYNNIIKILR